MSTNILTDSSKSRAEGASARLALIVLTLMLSGRAMTLAFIGRVAAGGPGDPPAAWLMPLVGDAVIGLSALVVAYVLVSRRGGLLGWAAVVSWNVLGIWDALSAYLVHRSVPWPSFFMIEIFGSSMFFAASLMHAICLYLTFTPALRGLYLKEEPS